jgi:hypothetical protein
MGRRVGTFAALAADILDQPPRRGSTRVVAVDGGSAAGKSTFAGRLASALGAPVLHTDDVAWWESFFGWWPLLIDGILEPLARGGSVRYRPPAWDRRDRPGAIEVPAAPAVVVEGVGASRQELAAYLDADGPRGARRPGRGCSASPQRIAWSSFASSSRTSFASPKSITVCSRSNSSFLMPA